MPVPKYGQVMRAHRLAVLPQLSTDEYRRLKVSLLLEGMKTPVILYEGQILDGRARWNICREAGLECPTQEYTGDSPLDEMFRLNAHRHHDFQTRKRIMIDTLALEPNRSNRDIARLVRIDKSYVSKERHRMIDGGVIDPVPILTVKKQKRLIKPITERLGEAKRLLDAGHDMHAVAEMLGCRGSYLKEQLKNHGYEIPAGTSLAGRGAIDRRAPRIMEESVNALVAVAQGLALVDMKKKIDISPEQAVALLRDVNPAMKGIKRAIAKLREVANVTSSQVIVNQNEG